MKFKYWVALFSQTGKEIIEISEQIDKKPDLIISNNHPQNVPETLNGVPYHWLTTFGKESKTLDTYLKGHDFKEKTIKRARAQLKNEIKAVKEGQRWVVELRDPVDPLES